MRRPLAWIALAAAGLGAYAVRRWGYPVVVRTRDVARVPSAPLGAVPEPPGRAAVQSEDEGTGARFHRRYAVAVRGASLEAEALMRRIGADVQAFVPDELARFEKTVGAEGALEAGDEFHIHITGPWDGPVRVAEVTDTSFTLATLEGHMEAGQIRFAAAELEDGALEFAVESWARSAGPAVDAVYDGLGVAKQGQQAMWTFFCERVVEASGGVALGPVEVVTERQADA